MSDFGADIFDDLPPSKPPTKPPQKARRGKSKAAADAAPAAADQEAAPAPSSEPAAKPKTSRRKRAAADATAADAAQSAAPARDSADGEPTPASKPKKAPAARKSRRRAEPQEPAPAEVPVDPPLHVRSDVEDLLFGAPAPTPAQREPKPQAAEDRNAQDPAADDATAEPSHAEPMDRTEPGTERRGRRRRRRSRRRDRDRLEDAGAPGHDAEDRRPSRDAARDQDSGDGSPGPRQPVAHDRERDRSPERRPAERAHPAPARPYGVVEPKHRIALLVDLEALSQQAHEQGAELAYRKIKSAIAGHDRVDKAICFLLPHVPESGRRALRASGFELEFHDSAQEATEAMVEAARAADWPVDAVVVAPMPIALQGADAERTPPLQDASFADGADADRRLGRACLFVP